MNTNARAEAAIHQAARRAPWPVTSTQLQSIERILSALAAGEPTCPDREHIRNRLSCTDDRIPD